MIEVKHLLRKAYIDKLAGLNLGGQSIPVCESYLPSNKKPGVLNLAGLPKGEAYVIIHNQTVDDASTKCGVNQGASLQMDIVTVYPAIGGSSLASELIANEVFSLLYPNGGQQMDISIPNLNVWRAWLVSSISIEQDTKESKIFRNNLIFNHSIQQN